RASVQHGLVLYARSAITIGESAGHDQESREGRDDALHRRLSFHAVAVAGGWAVGRGRQAPYLYKRPHSRPGYTVLPSYRAPGPAPLFSGHSPTSVWSPAQQGAA